MHRISTDLEQGFGGLLVAVARLGLTGASFEANVARSPLGGALRRFGTTTAALKGKKEHCYHLRYEDGSGAVVNATNIVVALLEGLRLTRERGAIVGVSRMEWLVEGEEEPEVPTWRPSLRYVASGGGQRIFVGARGAAEAVLTLHERGQDLDDVVLVTVDERDARPTAN